MKTNTTMSIDVKILAEARQRLGNISKFCEEAMKEALKMDDTIPSDLDEAQLKLAGKIAEVAQLRTRIDKLEKEAEKDKTIRVIQ